jgi:hypothetical protein
MIGVLGFDSRCGLGIFLLTTASRTALGPTQPPIQWVPGALSLGVKRPGREADPSPPSNAEVKECVELYLHSPNTPSWHGAQLKHRDIFTFTYIHSSLQVMHSFRVLLIERRSNYFEVKKKKNFYTFPLLSLPHDRVQNLREALRGRVSIVQHVETSNSRNSILNTMDVAPKQVPGCLLHFYTT